jgi:hypothetical protein
LFYVRFSRVWPGYYFFYNIRKFDFERECLDDDYLEEPPDDEWSDIQGKVIEILTFPEMTHFSLQDLEEEVPFILDGEMPLSMDDEVEPTLVPAILKQCLFDYP